jgi:putative restriction endonuclease
MAFGEIPRNPPGSPYDSYEQMVDAGVHRQNYVGIVGGARDGVESIVLNDGYADDQDSGNEVIYTGFGGQDTPRGRQVSWSGVGQGQRGPASQHGSRRARSGDPRVRGHPTYSPATGYRYDGLYAVIDTWQQPSRNGPLICRARLVKTDSAPVPTRPDAEGADISSLGTPHNGPDVKENVLCLCPNDHVRFDHGAIYLTDKLAVIDGGSGVEVGRLRLAKGHQIDLGRAAFHRGLFGY